jgi:uncharacterized membrane protein
MLVEFFKDFPPEAATFLIAMIPVTELRASIPFAMGFFHMPAWQAFLWSVVGNIIPAIFLVWLLKPISEWLSVKSKICKRFFDWWFKRAARGFNEKFKKYGFWALMIFVAIPLPATGAWTGAAAAFMFDLPKKKAILSISLGVIIAGIIVTLISGGAFAIAK